MQFKSKVAIVTGGNTGIGEADEAAAALSVRVGRGGSVGGLYEQ
jgi:NAD(P)-dependent dehydrogenase (short-subunit alcohol dehydrogenase family)